jgi:hypothetical protein
MAPYRKGTPPLSGQIRMFAVSCIIPATEGALVSDHGLSCRLSFRTARKEAGIRRDRGSEGMNRNFTRPIATAFATTRTPAGLGFEKSFTVGPASSEVLGK